jgi:DNA-binding beta-propeller fold protein YncE
MKRHSRPGTVARLVTIASVLALAITACSSDGGSDGDAASLEEAQAQIEALEAQLASAQVATQVVQSGELAPSQFDTVVPGDGWANEESVRGGLWLEATFDSEGPDAWDIEAHPRVYFTSESYDSNYFNDVADEDLPERFVGWYVIDAYSKEVVAETLFHYKDPITRGPHGVGVSPDGKWGYVGWSETPADGPQVSYVGIINVRTQKLDKILRTDAYDEDYCILQWGFGANGGPHHIIMPNDDNRVFRSITFDDVRPMGHPFTTPSPDGQFVYISMGSNWIREGHDTAHIAKYDITTGTHEVLGPVGSHPIGITHTQDGKYTYVVDGHSSFLYKIDNESGEVVDHASTGIAGPYGICLNWDETEAWINGKGEGTANLGNSMSIFDLTSFRASRSHGNTPFYLGGSASSVDHCALHPDPAVNEVWISNMKGWETIVVDLNTYTVEAYIPTPSNGDTHGMAFVWYDEGWDSGVLMGDMGGPKSQTFQDLVRANAAATGDAG